MAVLINTGDRQVKFGTFDTVENLIQSTATARQTISPHHPITTLSGGTATGFTIDQYTVRGTGTATGAPAVEGVRKYIYMLGTGEAKVVFESLATQRIQGTGFLASATVFDNFFVTATGAFVLSSKGQYLEAVFMNQQWNIVNGIATFATAS